MIFFLKTVIGGRVKWVQFHSAACLSSRIAIYWSNCCIGQLLRQQSVFALRKKTQGLQPRRLQSNIHCYSTWTVLGYLEVQRWSLRNFFITGLCTSAHALIFGGSLSGARSGVDFFLYSQYNVGVWSVIMCLLMIDAVTGSLNGTLWHAEMSREPFHKHAITNSDLQDINFKSHLSGQVIKLYLAESP